MGTPHRPSAVIAEHAVPRRLLAKRLAAIGVVAAGVAIGGGWVALHVGAGSDQARAAATRVAVIGQVTDIDGDSGRITATYDYGGGHYTDTFGVYRAGRYTLPGQISILVDPDDPSDARLVGEKIDFLPRGLVPFYRVSPWAAVILLAGGGWWAANLRWQAGVLRRFAAVLNHTGEADGRAVPLLERRHVVVDHTVFGAAEAGNIHLADGSVVGAVRFTADNTVNPPFNRKMIVDASDTTVASFEAPLRYWEGRGRQTVRDGNGVVIGTTAEYRRRRRDLFVTGEGNPAARYLRRGGLVAITGADGRLVAVVTRRWHLARRTTTLGVTVDALHEPLRTIVFANAVTAFGFLQMGRQGGGA